MGSVIDAEITRTKFDREVAAFWRYKNAYAGRGCFVVGIEFPEIRAVFCSIKTSPQAVVFGAVMRFDNYDFWPPSVKLVHPFSFVPYKTKELPTKLTHRLPTGPQLNLDQLLAQVAGQLPAGLQIEVQQQAPTHDYMQSFDLDSEPFICMAGIREYHECPAHTGDVWLRHRGKGEGTLQFVLDKLLRYGVEPLVGCRFGLQTVFQGFSQSQPPE